jgi:large subunit ribosomal protein L10
MDRAQKEQVVEEITARLNDAEAIFAIDYRGISVTQAAELRGALSEADASFNVVKNRLAKRAAEQAGREGLDDLLEGPTALTYVKGDVVTAAKAISNFNREHEVLTYKGGFMNGDALDEERFKSLARLPAVEVMHGQLVGTVAAPLNGLVRGLGSLLSGLAVALGSSPPTSPCSWIWPSAGSDPEPESAGSDPTGEAESAEPEASEETENQEEPENGD